MEDFTDYYQVAWSIVKPPPTLLRIITHAIPLTTFFIATSIWLLNLYIVHPNHVLVILVKIFLLVILGSILVALHLSVYRGYQSAGKHLLSCSLNRQGFSLGNREINLSDLDSTPKPEGKNRLALSVKGHPVILTFPHPATRQQILFSLGHYLKVKPANL